jgi:GalNAc5-diNAcBac-PP-undecaprenol beta-1,3-glucosyltransferase
MTSNDLAKHYAFTVIITTYDRPDFLRESLKAAINQTHKPLEVLIIDDNSSKDYTSVLSEFPAGSFTYHKFS